MRIVGFDDGDRVLDWAGVVAAIAEGHLRPPAEIGDLLLKQSGNSLLNRAAWIVGLGIALKSVTVYPDNPSATPPRPSVQGSVLLFDGETGAPSALIDGPLVTKWKTAGDSVLAASKLARPDSRTLVVCGAGTLAQSLVEAYSAIFPDLKQILIWNRTPERANELGARYAGTGLSVQAVTDLAASVAEADIVATATMSSTPILRGEWLKPGTHVDLIGAYRGDMREADDVVLRRGRLFVDSFATTIGHIGEIEIPLKAGTLSRADILGDLHAICADTAGRRSADEITIFKNGGGAHLDLMVAAHILSLL